MKDQNRPTSRIGIDPPGPLLEETKRCLRSAIEYALELLEKYPPSTDTPGDGDKEEVPLDMPAAE